MVCTLVTLLWSTPAPPPAAAQEATPEEDAGAERPPDRWKVSAEFSYTDQSGNKVLRLLSGGLSVSHREKEAFELEGSVESRYGRSGGEVVARNDFGSLSVDLQPNRSWSPFLFFTAERDPLKRLAARFNGGAGAKYTPYRGGGNDEVSLSLALLYSYEDVSATEEFPALTPASRSARWSLRGRASRELRPGISLQHTSFYQPIVDEVANYLLRSETGAKVLLMERLALSIGYQLNRTSQPPEGVEPEDRLFKTGLIIDF